jgi:hypothetical protein
LGWSGSDMWKAGAFKVVAPACVSYGPMGCPPRVSIECSDRMLVIWASKPSSLSLIEAWLKSTASLVGIGEKLGMDPRIGQPT